MGRPAQGGPRCARVGGEERESRWTGLTTRGPGWDPLVSDSAHRAEGARGAALGGPRARGRADRVGSTRSRPSWRRRGAYVAATRAGGRTRGDEPTARIRRRMPDGGELRQRHPAAEEGGNGDEVTWGRFPAARASTWLRESDASVGLGGATPSEASDERRFRARAATAASTRRAAATVGAAPASYGEATRVTTEN
uniref:Epstein-Barr virus EBNA-1-like protein n=1 Tax=Oryza sativa subsp. japonica TaxID=39947 RepID=Q5VMW4_ORYSJ|nr:Epstein-Barr virus EBNA-1-like protein [Oryza sativa Japonica Group]